MLKPHFFVHANGFPPIVWLGAGIAVASGILALILPNTESTQVVPMTTTHPSVPKDLFSSRVLAAPRFWCIAKAGLQKPLALSDKDKLSFRSQDVMDWTCVCGDKLSHSILSLLVCIGGQVKLPRADSENRRAAFALYLEAMLAELHLQMLKKGHQAVEADALLGLLSKTILQAPLDQLAHYQRLVPLCEGERAETTARAVNETFGATSEVQKNFHAAYVLLKLISAVLVSELPRR